jgi:hypothetical protein
MAFSLLVVMLTSVHAQERSKWSIGFTAMPQYYNCILDKGYYNNVHPYADKHSDQGGPGFVVGAQLKYDFTKRFSLQTGVVLNKFWFRTGKITEKVPYLVSQYPPYTVYYTTKISNPAYYNTNLQLPLILTYKLILKPAFYWDMGVGFSWNCLQYVKELDFTTKTREDSYMFSKFYFRMNTAFAWKIKKKYVILDIDYSLSPFSENEGRYYYSLGAGISMMFDLKKRGSK